MPDAAPDQWLQQTERSTVAPCYSSLSAKEIALWCMLYVMALTGLLHHFGGPGLSDDSYQYLSEAENIDAGYGLTTSIVHFDMERSHARLPAPLTTFPPGYSLAIAGITRTGRARETAGLLVSAVSFILMVPLIACAAGLLEMSPMATRIALVLLLGSFAAGLYATAVATESLFTALSLGALVCLLLHERGKGSTVAAATGNLIVGCACWVRYAGLFLFAAVATYLAWRAFRRRDRQSLIAAGCLTLPATLIGVLLARNIVLTGSWKGGNTKAVAHPLAAVVKQFGVSIYHLFFGAGVPSRLDVLKLALGIGLASLCVLFLMMLVRVATQWGIRRTFAGASSGAELLLVYVAVYNAGMIYLGMFSVISFDSRMLFPLLPVYFVLLGLILTRVQRLPGTPSASLAWTVCASILIASYWGINLESTMAHSSSPPDRAVAASFGVPSATGRNLRSWLETNVPPEAIIVASNGQATAYALKRKVVSLVGSHFSDERWDEHAVRHVMQEYGAGFLILYPQIDPMIEPVQQESPFLQGLIEGRRPQWLQLAAENGQVMIFQTRTSELASLKKYHHSNLPPL